MNDGSQEARQFAIEDSIEGIFAFFDQPFSASHCALSEGMTSMCSLFSPER